MALSERESFELIVGPDALGSCFRSDAVRRKTYFDHQGELHDGLPPGRRPWAFWHYVLDENPAVDDEPRLLAERDLLHPEEESAILALAATDAALAAAAAVILSREARSDD